MALAALLGGLSFALPKTAACHACSYPLSEDYHLPHGEACAFTLDSFVAINADERLCELCRRAGLSGTEELMDRIRALKALGGLRSYRSEAGQRMAFWVPLLRPVFCCSGLSRALFVRPSLCFSVASASAAAAAGCSDRFGFTSRDGSVAAPCGAESLARFLRGVSAAACPVPASGSGACSRVRWW